MSGCVNEIRYDKVDEVINYLLGTCKSLVEGLAACGISELNDRELEYLDSEIFECDACGWWSETCERNLLNGDAICDDCLDMEVNQD